MLQRLRGIRHKIVTLACTVLRKHLHSMLALEGPSIFGRDPPTPSLGSAPHHVLHVVHLAYLDEIQDASV
jgi:hypothetical protein